MTGSTGISWESLGGKLLLINEATNGCAELPLAID
jgi:hypothetical protein